MIECIAPMSFITTGISVVIVSWWLNRVRIDPERMQLLEGILYPAVGLGFFVAAVLSYLWNYTFGFSGCDSTQGLFNGGGCQIPTLQLFICIVDDCLQWASIFVAVICVYKLYVYKP